MITIEQALKLIGETIQLALTEKVSLESAPGRVSSQPVRTDIDSPPHDKSVMDGFAVIAADVKLGKHLQVIETVPAGAVPTQTVVTGTATRIMTGAPLPQGADAVVMVELTEFDEANQSVKINLESLKSQHHVMTQASAMAKGDEVFANGHRFRAQDVGLLAECGASQVEVFAQPSIAVLPTGDELVGCDQFPGPGMIRNSNGPMLLSLARQQTSLVRDLGVGLDDRISLSEKVAAGLQSDFLVLSGGVSAGILDLVPSILKEQGVEEVFHKVAVKPGKPIWFGVKRGEDRDRYVFGLPGNPVSSLVGFNLFARAALAAHRGGDLEQKVRYVPAKLAQDHEIRGNRVTYWPVEISKVGSELMATPIDWRGSSDMRALGRSNGLAVFDPVRGSRFEAGDFVDVLRLEG
jgi:molybdopterin molybdotransferase